MPQDNKNLFNLIRCDLPSYTRPDFLTLLPEEGYPTFAYTAVNSVADLTGIPVEAAGMKKPSALWAKEHCTLL